MTGFVWYSPEYDFIIIQWAYGDGKDVFMNHFEWSAWDLCEFAGFKPDDPMQCTTWFPLGDL